MKKLRLLLVGSFALVATAAPASAGTHLDLFWAPTYGMGSFTAGMNYVGAGGRLEFGLGPVLGLTIGYAYQQHTIGAVAANSSEIPVTLALHLAKVIDLEAGGYGSYFTTLGPLTTAVGYGLRGGGGLDIPLGMRFGLLAHAYYQYNLANQGAGLTLNEIVFNAGFRIALGGMGH